MFRAFQAQGLWLGFKIRGVLKIVAVCWFLYGEHDHLVDRKFWRVQGGRVKASLRIGKTWVLEVSVVMSTLCHGTF